MNLNLNLSSVTPLLKKFSYGDRIRPVRDWWGLVLVTLVLLVLVAGWSYGLFVRVSGGETSGGQSQPTEDASGSSLEMVKTIFDRRSAERSHYLTDYRFVDPSR